ncbi:MAG TPA: hypothetical protein DGG95_10280 [Cytophagales bacterium]|nr:hypothetical protein [Cytophagales bacterium]
MQAQAEKIDDRIISRRIAQLLKNLISLCDLENEESSIAEEKKRVQNEIHQFQNRTLIRIPASIWPLVLDYSMRWAILLAFSYYGFEKFRLIGFNFFLIPILILLLTYSVGRSHRRKNKQLLDTYGETRDFKIEISFFNWSIYHARCFFSDRSIYKLPSSRSIAFTGSLRPLYLLFHLPEIF